VEAVLVALVLIQHLMHLVLAAVLEVLFIIPDLHFQLQQLLQLRLVLVE
jgi:hypothetical protein